jgi:hypothetical protein
MKMKRILLSAILAAASFAASATTFVPIQLLNPAGSTANQLLVSTGPSTAPVWNNNNLSFTGQTTFSNTTSGAAIFQMIGNGATTPNKYLGVLNGFFTIFSSNAITQLLSVDDSGNVISRGSIAPSQAGGIIGTTTNNNANSGSVGEYLTATNSGTSLTNATSANIASISLTAGDWDVTGFNTTVPAGGTITTSAAQGLTTTSATFPTANTGSFTNIPGSSGAGVVVVGQVGPVRFSLSTTTTVFLVANCNFSGGTMTANGFIRARRIR